MRDKPAAHDILSKLQRRPRGLSMSRRARPQLNSHVVKFHAYKYVLYQHLASLARVAAEPRAFSHVAEYYFQRLYSGGY